MRMGALEKEKHSGQYPRVYDDLVYASDPNEQSTSCVVKDPKTARYFRFGRDAALVMQAMDGTRSIEELGEYLGLNPKAVQLVADRLAQLHLLDEGLDVADLRKRVEEKRRKQRLWINRLLLVRKEIVHPDAWMERLYQLFRMKYIFRPWFAVFLAMLYGAAYLVYDSNIDAIRNAFVDLLDPRWILLGWVVWFSVSILHELAHGFACKHFGGAVRSIGVGLYYFRFVFYCDVTDAWMFTKRHQRLVTHGAGLLMNLFLGSLAVFVIPLSGDLSWLRATAALVFAISGVRSLVNLNPLIKLDGYFLLSDALGIENLRSKAFRRLFIFVRHGLYRLGLLREPPPVRTERPNRRERWVMLPYAFLSLSYVALMLSYLGYRVGELLVEYVGLWGWVLSFTFALAFLFIPLWSGWKDSQRPRRDFHRSVA